jgi:hypothetical protein
MIDPVRQEMLDQLQRLSELAPDVRFGQLIANLTFLAAGPWDEHLWDIDDEVLLDAMRRHVDDLARTIPDPAAPKAQSHAS